jgi:mRNA-degrading endonuclease RelE of RelBE toxin-antitoxin system
VIVEATAPFRRALAGLDRSEQKLVLNSIERLKVSGYATGKLLQGELHGCRSIRVGHHNRLRIVYSADSGELLQLLVIGPRERGLVYIQAIEVLKELER